MKILNRIKKRLSANRRFLKLYEKLEREGFDLFSVVLRNRELDPHLEMRINRYQKNIEKLNKLYDRFTNE